MRSTGKDSQLSKKKGSGGDVFLLLLFVVLVGGLVWYFWTKEPNWDHDYKVLGKYSTSPTAEEVSKLISGNRSRLKTAKRILAGEMRGRKLSTQERVVVENELKNVDEELDKFLQEFDLKEVEKKDPEALVIIYNQVYEQGKVAVRLKDKTSINRPREELKKQLEVQEKWKVSPEEEKDIKEKMNYWLKSWYQRAKNEIIGEGKEQLLTEYIVPHWYGGKKVDEDEGLSPEMAKKFKTVHHFKDKSTNTASVVDLSKPLVINFQGYYGFLTEEDKQGSSEGSETFGLTKSDFNMQVGGSGEFDKDGNPIGNPSPEFYSFSFCEGNVRPIKIGFEERFFFNRLGYEEWLTEVKVENKRTYFDICFEEIVETIAHELAHALVNSIKAVYHGQEGGGHGKFFYDIMKKIEKMIKDSPDFSEFKTWWERPEKEQKEWAAANILTDGKKGHWDEWKHWYIVGGVGILAVGLVVVVFWDKLTDSKKNGKN